MFKKSATEKQYSYTWLRPVSVVNALDARAFMNIDWFDKEGNPLLKNMAVAFWYRSSKKKK